MKRFPVCGDCVFFVLTQVGEGECHATPPHATPLLRSSPVDPSAPPVLAGVVSVFPVMRSSALGCGAFRQDVSIQRQSDEPTPENVTPIRPPEGA